MKRFFNTKAQSTIEFTFAVVVTMFLIYGMIQVFRWAGMDLAQRRYAQDAAINTKDLGVNGNPAYQFNSEVNDVLPMDTLFHGAITGGNEQQ